MPRKTYKSVRRKKPSLKMLVVFGLLILSGVAIAFLTGKKEIKPTENNLETNTVSKDCEDIISKIDIPVKNWSYFLKSDPKNQYWQGVSSKEDKNQPFIAYEAENGMSVSTKKAPLSTINIFYEDQIKPILTSNNYVDTFSPGNLNKFGEYLSGYAYIYTKGDIIVNVNIKDNFSTKEDHDLLIDEPNYKSNLLIYCGKKDAKNIAMFASLKKSDDFINKFKKNYILSLQHDYGNIIVLGVNSYDFNGGHASWFANNNGNWGIIHEGHTYPTCEVLENHNAPSGLNCINFKGIQNEYNVGKTK